MAYTKTNPQHCLHTHPPECLPQHYLHYTAVLHLDHMAELAHLCNPSFLSFHWARVPEKVSLIFQFRTVKKVPEPVWHIAIWHLPVLHHQLEASHLSLLRANLFTCGEVKEIHNLRQSSYIATIQKRGRENSLLKDNTHPLD